MNIMNLFGLEGSSFIISLGLTLLVAGVIMFYCLRRFNMLETSIIEQGRILQSFIMRMQERENSSTQLANDIAINSALNQTMVKEDVSKIEVSDDEDEDKDEDEESDYDESDDDESDDDESDKNEQDEDDDNKEKDNINLENQIVGQMDNDKCIDISKLTEISNIITDKTFNSVVSLELSNLDSPLDIVEIETTSSNSETDESEKDKLLETLHPGELENIEKIDEVEKLEKIEKTDIKQSIMKLKVGELRNLVCEKGILESMEQAKKISKDELIKMLS